MLLPSQFPAWDGLSRTSFLRTEHKTPDAEDFGQAVAEILAHQQSMIDLNPELTTKLTVSSEVKQLTYSHGYVVAAASGVSKLPVYNRPKKFLFVCADNTALIKDSAAVLVATPAVGGSTFVILMNVDGIIILSKYDH